MLIYQQQVARFLRCLLVALLFASASVFAAPPPLPVIPSQTFYLTNYGAIGDGITTNTTAIKNAISAAAASALHGGTVEITPGIFLSGPFTLASGINLQIDGGAILRMLPYDKYPGGIVSPADFITGSNLKNVEISGSGAIDGQGSPWWPGYKTNNRPVMLSLSACSTGLIQDVTFSNSPAQHLVIKGKAGNFTIQGITVLNSQLTNQAFFPIDPANNSVFLRLIYP
jgi:polygalacturonase